MTHSPLLLLGGPGDFTNIVANELRKRFGPFPIIIEQRETSGRLARRRAAKLGWRTAAGQVLFMLTAAPCLRVRSRARIEEIKREAGLDSSPLDAGVTHVSSVNSDEATAQLQAVAPRLAIVNGTRILGRKLLGSISGRFLNMHAGITPAFRGCHGAYWAMATGAPQLAGATIHWIDPGIDTGKVIKQALIRCTQRDNFVTYPYLQLAAGLPLLVQTIEEVLEGRLTESAIPGREALGSHLFHHPTLWEYLRGRARGVR